MEELNILLMELSKKDPSAISGGFDISHLSLDDVEQIEILRGEQSALWGF